MWYLIVSTHPVLCSVFIVDVKGALGGVDGQHVVVGANPVPLGVLVRKHSALQDLVVAEGDTCTPRQQVKYPAKLPDMCACTVAPGMTPLKLTKRAV